MPKISQSIEETTVDKDGKVIQQRVNKTLNWGAEPQYVKLYLADILYLSDMPKGNENLLFELIKCATYANEKGMLIILNASLKRMIAKNLKISSIRSINNALTQLVKGKILRREDPGIYSLNPFIFGKGDWQDIARLRLEVDYSLVQGRTFRSVIEYGKPETEEATEETAKKEEDTNANANPNPSENIPSQGAENPGENI